MSRRAAIVEEFDDDTDLPLPSMPLPNTGSRGPLLQEIDSDEDTFDYKSAAGSASASVPQQRPFGTPGIPGQPHQWSGEDGRNVSRVTDITPYKSWTCVYPIYIDAKRPYGTGQRRVARAKSLWWPLSKDIADAATRLGLGTLHEVNKAHPRDWENPGRVRVQWKKDGKLMNPVIKTKKQLLEMICYQLQMLKPENIPKPPYNLGIIPISAPPQTTPEVTNEEPPAAPAQAPPVSAPTAQKAKTPAKSRGPSSQSQSHHHSATDPSKPKPSKRLLPVPPEPLPTISNRLSAYSPALASGVLIETVKAGMNAQPDPAAPGTPGTPGPPGGLAKGKRKVVRVRG